MIIRCKFQPYMNKHLYWGFATNEQRTENKYIYIWMNRSPWITNYEWAQWKSSQRSSPSNWFVSYDRECISLVLSGFYRAERVRESEKGKRSERKRENERESENEKNKYEKQMKVNTCRREFIELNFEFHSFWAFFYFYKSTHCAPISRLCQFGTQVICVLFRYIVLLWQSHVGLALHT